MFVDAVLAALVIALPVVSGRFWGRRRERPEITGSPPLEPTPPSDAILELIEEGVLIVDESLTAVRANRAARLLLGTGDVLPPRLPSDDLLSIARRVVVDHLPVEDIVELRAPGRKSLLVRASYLERTGGAVLLLRDASQDQRNQRMRRQFVTHASHELKTPIAAIQLLAEAVSNASENDPARTRHFAESLLQESQRLNRLVTDLLDLSRLEDPGTIANSFAVLSDVAVAEFAEARPQAAAKTITMQAAVDDGVVVRGDEGQLALMVRNLLDNAVRYTPPEGQIDLRVGIEGDEAVLQVADTGAGIPLRDQARVFERFYRVDKGRSREQGGTGLGLAIVKHVADLHGGHVSLSSELGEGSTFTVALPLVRRRSQDSEASEETG
jgi:two-component system, OmpR family, sensor histidine kinase SenX3